MNIKKIIIDSFKKDKQIVEGIKIYHSMLVEDTLYIKYYIILKAYGKFEQPRNYNARISVDKPFIERYRKAQKMNRSLM